MVSEVDLNQTLLLRWQLLQHAVGSGEAEEGLVEEDSGEEAAAAVSVDVVGQGEALVIEEASEVVVEEVSVVEGEEASGVDLLVAATVDLALGTTGMDLEEEVLEAIGKFL